VQRIIFVGGGVLDAPLTIKRKPLLFQMTHTCPWMARGVEDAAPYDGVIKLIIIETVSIPK
jgi:hypothetical protein